MLKAGTRGQKAQVDTKKFNLPVARQEFVTGYSVIIAFIIFYEIKICLASQLVNKYFTKGYDKFTFLFISWGLGLFKFFVPQDRAMGWRDVGGEGN